MTGKYKESDFSGIRTIPFEERVSKVSLDDYGKPAKGGSAFREWFDLLPDQLAGSRIKEIVRSMEEARSSGKQEIIWMIGAHVIKCGLPLYLIEMMKTGFMTSLAVNGACAIHDIEIAFFGKTSEDVAANLKKGIFGFTEETASLLAEAVDDGVTDGLGLGEAIGRYISRKKAPNRDKSLFASAYEHDIPVTVHIAIGTDIINQHPSYDGSAWGGLSYRDFRIFCQRVENLGFEGGIVVNAGSAVILPEVFLKAFSVARNKGASFSRITTCNLDIIQHYRPGENVLNRPASFGGRSIAITGHHEIIIPILYSALIS
ncbi:MAG: hypothetical protein KOO63_15220 [Bacteroidales bacterium]|nr:hypothetical protein [Candidatus Latescibacterota bacterium]